MHLKNNITGEKANYVTAFYSERKNGKTVFRFSAENSRLYCPYKQNNQPLYEGDVCEVFIGRRDAYYEIEVSPEGNCFFAMIKNDGNGKFHPEKFLDCRDIEYSAEKTDAGYNVTIGVPDAIILSLCGDGEILFNAFRIETDGGEKEKYLYALSPTLCGTFHLSEAFIRLQNCV